MYKTLSVEFLRLWYSDTHWTH